MREIEMLDAEETQRPQSTDTIIYQDVREEARDEIQQGRINVLGTGGTIVAGGRAGHHDDDEEPKKKKESSPMDKTPKKEKL